MIKIVADSSCDILSMEGMDFSAVPMTISTKEKTYVDDAELDIHKMLDELAAYKDRSYTACPSSEAWCRAFGGADEIYVFTLTSYLSGTYNSACLARDLYLEDHPDAKVRVFDSLSTGSEMLLLLEKTRDLILQGLPFEEICQMIDSYSKSTRIFFAFQSLHNFAQNGRVNKVLASAISTLKISLLGTASTEGNIEVVNKCRGEKKVIAEMINACVSAGCKGGRIRISHVENKALAGKIAQALQTLYPDSEILVYQARGLVSYYGERGGVIVGLEC